MGLTALGVDMTVPIYWKEESFFLWRRADGIHLKLGWRYAEKVTCIVWVVSIPPHLLKTYGIPPHTDETTFSVKRGSMFRALKYVDQLYSPSPAMRKHMPVDWLGSPTDQISRM